MKARNEMKKTTNKSPLKKMAAALLLALLCLGCFPVAAFAAQSASMTQAQKEFIDKISAWVAADMRQSGILASLTLAQAILESNWGKSALAVKANALFGIKADSKWNGKVYTIATKEYVDRVNYVTVNAKFRAYDSWEQSIADHSDFLVTRSRYAAVVGEKSYKKACAAIEKAGYATDPRYGDKLVDLIEAYGLAAYDTSYDAAANEVYTVAKGDSLWKIAKRKLGKGGRYHEIKFLNQLTSNRIKVGQKLMLPV